MTFKGPSQPQLLSDSDMWCLEGHLTASLYSCSMHIQPPHSLGLDHTLAEPFPSLKLQRWTSSAVALLRCKLPSSLKCPALGVSLLAAISVPQLLPQEACGYWAIPRHHLTSCNAQCIQPSLTPNMNKGLRCLPSIDVPQVALSLLLVLLSCNSQWESASHATRTQKLLLFSRSKVQWTGSACDYLKLFGREGGSGTAAEEGRKQTRRGRSSPGVRQHFSLFYLERFSEPCSIWPFTWAEKSDSRCW